MEINAIATINSEIESTKIYDQDIKVKFLSGDTLLMTQEEFLILSDSILCALSDEEEDFSELETIAETV